MVSDDVDTSWLELRGTIRVSEDIRAYVSYHTLEYAAGTVQDELSGIGAGLIASF